MARSGEAAINSGKSCDNDPIHQLILKANPILSCSQTVLHFESLPIAPQVRFPDMSCSRLLLEKKCTHSQGLQGMNQAPGHTNDSRCSSHDIGFACGCNSSAPTSTFVSCILYAECYALDAVDSRWLYATCYA